MKTQPAPELERLATRLSAQFTKEMVRDKDATIYALTLSTLEAHPDVVLAVNSHAALTSEVARVQSLLGEQSRRAIKLADEKAALVAALEALLVGRASDSTVPAVVNGRAALALAKGGAL